jgi:hypothetical protein
LLRESFRMKHFSVILLAIFALLTAGVQASAAPSDLTLKAGGFVPTDANASGSNGHFSAGAEYVVVHQTAVTPFNLSLYGDVFGSSGGAGFSVRNSGPVYLGAGLGFYHVSITQAGGCPAIGQGCPASTLTSSGAGGKVFAGLNVAKDAALEAGYHFLPSAAGISTNTFTASVVVRM